MRSTEIAWGFFVIGVWSAVLPKRAAALTIASHGPATLETIVFAGIAAFAAAVLLAVFLAMYRRIKADKTPFSDEFWTISPSFFIALDARGRILAMNRAVLESLGCAESELTGVNFLETFVPAPEIHPMREAVEGALKNCPPKVLESRMKTPSGDEIVIAWRIQRSRKAGGDAVLLSGIDITDYKRAQEALASSERRYRLYAENVRDVLWVMDTDLRYVYISPSVYQLRGYTQEEALSLPMERLFTPGSLRKLLKIVSDVKVLIAKGDHIDPQTTLKLELEQYCKDGSIKWTELIASLLFDETGRHIGFLGVTRDITERKLVQESLRLSEERYRTIFETTGNATVIVRDDDVISLANSEFEKLSGYGRDALEGKMSWKEFIAGEDRDRVMGYHRARRMDPASAPKTYDFRFTDRYGRIRNVVANATLLPGTTMSVVSLMDITERIEAEERLRISREQLRNLNMHTQELRERERANVAREIHDELGQVLTALKMDLAYLAKRLPENRKDLLAKVSSMSRSIDASIDSVRRIIMELRPGLLDHLGLVPAIEWQAQEFQERTGISCRLSLPHTDILLDRDIATTVFRIFQEALTNVARHAQASVVDVKIATDAHTLTLTVHDNGKGITKNEVEDPKALGLMGMRERAFFCNGTFDIYPDEGGGTTVTLCVPTAKARGGDDQGSGGG